MSVSGTLGWLAFISLLAGTAKGLTGFGGALVMAPLFSILIGAPQAAVLIVLVHCATSLQGAREWVIQAHWRIIAPLALVATACTAVCARLIAHADAAAMRHLVAWAVLAITALHAGGCRWRHQGGWLRIAGTGMVSGALTALGGLGGPPAMYFFSGITQGTALRANLLGYFALLFSGSAIVLTIDHRISSDEIGTTLLLIPAFVGGVALGERLGKRLAPHWFDRAVTALLFSSGVIALIT